MRFALAAVVVGSVLAGCGSGTLSEEEFVDLADPICADVAEQVDQEEFLDWGPALRDAADSLSELEAPDGAASDLVTTYDELATAHDELVTAIDDAVASTYPEDERDQVQVFFTEDGTVWAGEGSWIMSSALDVPPDLFLSVTSAADSAGEAAQQLSLDTCSVSLGEEGSDD